MLLKDFYQDKLHVYTFDTRKEMGDCAGTQAAEVIGALLAEKDEVNIIFAAAPSQNETLAALKAANIDWTRINAYHMDEYIGLPDEHPAGFRNFLKAALFDDLPFKTVNLLNGNAPVIEEEIARYESLLREHPVDVCMLGVGENGHIAFNDPWVADFDDPALVKIVPLDEKCRNQQVHDGCFAELSQVPTHALTLTIPALTNARHMFCTVPAATKADAVKAMLSGEVTIDCPASILTKHADARLYTDRDAAQHIL